MAKILIADDDHAIVDALKLMLEMNGHQVTSTVNGAEVKDLIKVKPNIIFLDIWMSGIDGTTICKEIKKETTSKNIPIIMISASKDIKKTALEAGADDFIAKPFEMDELLNKIKKYTTNVD
jgi:DNA-binding response OmpR family regulator